MFGLNGARPWLGALAFMTLAACAPPPRPSVPVAANGPSVSTVFRDKESYLAQHFTVGFLPKSVQDSVTQAGAAQLGFDRVRLTERVTMQKNGADAPTIYVSVATYENAGNGLVRGMSTLQTNGFDVSTTFSLNYRGVYPLRYQTFQSSATRWPGLAEAKQIDHYDADFASDHLSYVYHGGYSERPQIGGTQEINCNAGRRYDAAALNASITGQVRELTCQVGNYNGVVSETVVYAYLEKYGFAVVLNRQDSAGHFESSISEFRAE
ncbi:hypothetical protein [Dyella choica]|uniref:Lipoprotein n=1 Tax=Dyella choica TaxID=1927959 RepID=A0A3S0R1F1_9GAMM|nr:hypothetical protein [Dyella choica]RUL71439.1 hypothetical protein EKH80_18810 [Dyella choica]